MKPFHRLTPRMALQLAAPPTWAASVYPAVFGELYCLYYGYPMTAAAAVLLVLACVSMQSAVNTLNDYFDFIKGTDCADDYVEVSDAVLVYEHINPKHVLLLGLAYIGLAGLLALPVLLTSGWAPLVIGGIGSLVVWAYSGGAVPISYVPIGEFVSGFVMGGLIPMGIVAAVSNQFDFGVLLRAIPLIIGIGLIMMTNNTCDIEKDRKVGRHTLPAIVGHRNAVRIYRCTVWVWVLAISILPVWYVGVWGLVSPVCLALAARSAFAWLLHSPLTAPVRVAQMKGVVKANIAGNGAYLLAWAVALLKGGA